jgi:hypothetical protein
MATVAFPTSIGDKMLRETPIPIDQGVESDIVAGGASRSRVLTTDDWALIACRFPVLTETEKNTLVSFLTTNKLNTITWTIDGIDFEGSLWRGRYETQRVGASYYSVVFEYRARIV